MKRLLLISLLLLPFGGCVGQKDDPEPVVDPVVDPVDGSADTGTRFFRRTLAFDFTATWCQYCPNMAAGLETAKSLRPGRIVNVAVHYADEFSSKDADDIVNSFRVSVFPTLLFDLDASTVTFDPSTEPMTTYVDRLLQTDAPCGIGWTLSEAGLTLKVKAAEAGDYRVAALLVEDGIVTPQVGAGQYYAQNAVIRKVLTGSFLGDSVGHLSEGEEKTLEAGKVPEGERLRIVAYILSESDGTLRAVNVAEGKSGEEKEYRYEIDS